MPTVEQLADALQRAQPRLAGTAERAQELAGEAKRELARWGHAGHELVLERIHRPPGGSEALRCLFWCESCHVSQLLVLGAAEVR